ncbi:MAG: SLATT domain-containing protein [Sedimenticola thiotaurini]|uniref:SLATT domain-containing protein n=1 Tax=Sedimenticola thiotaurini TaxID=1543721 RepID=A0A558CKZ9_9GAMM|nr:MAG: SLATT domain-containing protein [Sedimenticola thiotaurini]
MDATSKTRFNASRRLRLHSKFSTYTVVIISLGLILISLMQAYGLGNNIESSLVGFIQVFSAVAVLVYSLLIDKNDYSNLSEKMYSCASKLGELKQKVHPHLEKEHDQKEYDSFRDEYHGVLKLYETHANNDFRGDYFRAKLEMPENYEIKGIDWWVMKAQIYLLHVLDFISYPIVLGSLGWVVCWLWFGDAPNS